MCLFACEGGAEAAEEQDIRAASPARLSSGHLQTHGVLLVRRLECDVCVHTRCGTSYFIQLIGGHWPSRILLILLLHSHV